MTLQTPTRERYAHILQTCEPFLVSHRANLDHLDLSPFGLQIDAGHLYDPTRLSSRHLIDGLHHLDGFSFGPEAMRMARWVLYDCGEFPGVVFGFGRRAADLPRSARERYEALDDDDAFLPLSMWVAIRCAEPGAWFGHNLSSANLVLEGEHALPGLGTLTKLLAVRLTGASRQYGATQWSSPSLAIHLSLGPMRLLSAYTPAHTHPETLTYRIDVDPDALRAALAPDFERPDRPWDLDFAVDDLGAIKGLHDTIEAGQDCALVGLEWGEPRRARVAVG